MTDMSDFAPLITPMPEHPAARERFLMPSGAAEWPAERDVDAAITAQSACEALEQAARARGREELVQLAEDAVSATEALVRALSTAYDEGFRVTP